MAFLALPVIDLYLLVKLGAVIGGEFALLIALAGAVVGIVLGRARGLRQLQGWQTQLAQGRAPDQNVVEALLVLIACAWFVVPGVLSDALALLLLIPALRRWMAARATARVLRAIERGMLQVNVRSYGPAAPREATHQDVIDVEGEEVQPEAPSGGARKLFSR